METKLPPWARRLAIVAPVCGAVGIIVTTWADIRDRLQKTDLGNEVIYQTTAPAIVELQQMVGDMNARLARIEGFLDGRKLISDTPAADEEEPSAAFDEDEVILDPFDPPAAFVPPPQEPQRVVPKDLGAAKIYQKKREQLQCPENDPTCGGASLLE